MPSAAARGASGDPGGKKKMGKGMKMPMPKKPMKMGKRGKKK